MQELAKGKDFSVTRFDESDGFDNLIATATVHSFGIGSALLTRGHQQAIQAVVELLEEIPTATCEVAGMASRSGSAKFNKKLSLDRANAVVNALQCQGIPNRRIPSVNSYGEDGWASIQVKDGTENGEHRCVTILIYDRNCRLTTSTGRQFNRRRSQARLARV